ncbi:MAG: GIY-YIG nuclease family protein [Cellvibrionales bacterium]|nr:GIY-YIG nuclease family protein [Cellvibrionales bacterium]
MKKQQLWLLYIIETQGSKLYTGITTDVARRFNEHYSDPIKGAKFFRTDKPKKVLYQEAFCNRSEASKREQEIKKMSRKQKILLINSGK